MAGVTSDVARSECFRREIGAYVTTRHPDVFEGSVHRFYLAAGAIDVIGGNISTQGNTTFVNNSAEWVGGETQFGPRHMEQGSKMVVTEGKSTAVPNRYRKSCQRTS